MDFEDFADPDPKSLEMLDPDPYPDPDSIDPDPQTVISLGLTENITKLPCL